MRVAKLHCHTRYSIKDAIPYPKDYVRAIYDYNDKNTGNEIIGFAQTDHGNLFGMIDLAETCLNPLKGDDKERTMKPVFGNEVYCVDNYPTTKEEFKNEFKYHLVLLAKNQKGLKNLFAITTEAGMNQFKSTTKSFQMVKESFLDNYGEGIIALSACIGGRIPQLILANKYDEAKKLALHFKDIFEEFYLEIQPHDIPDQKIVNEALKRMSSETGIPMVITDDSHYIYKEDKEYHDILKEIDHVSPFNIDAHMRTPEELIDWCNENGFPLEIIENTAKIYDSCNADVFIRKPDGSIDEKGLMPDYPVPEGYTQDTYLKEQVMKGLKERIITNKTIKNIDVYISRLNYEFHVISSMKFSGYFLILWDWFKWCKENNILLGPGRGSGAGSLVCYCLFITRIDPIKNKLLFERFLNLERLEEPDIDSDCSKLDRAKAISYIQNKYGKDYVCQIATFGQYKVKNLIKAILSSDKGFTADFQNSITKGIPDLLGGETVTYDLLEDIYNNPDKHGNLSNKEIKQANNAYEKIQSVCGDYPQIEKALKKLCGAVSTIGCHAGGVIISSKRLIEHLPLMKGGKATVLPVSQLDMEGMHELHLLKIDVLGLKLLSQIHLCMKLSNLKREWYDDEFTDDPKVYEFLREGYTCNVFQMGKHTPRQMIKDFNVHNLEGLNAVNACNRPGRATRF